MTWKITPKGVIFSVLKNILYGLFKSILRIVAYFALRYDERSYAGYQIVLQKQKNGHNTASYTSWWGYVDLNHRPRHYQ